MFATKARIIGLGAYLPKQVLSNLDLEQKVETSDEWIVKRTGVRERRIAAPDEAASDMGAKAAEQALQRAGCTADQIDLILVATMSSDYVCPSTASLIQNRIGAGHTPAFDLGAACTGFIYGVSVARAYIESGMYKNVLVVATEKLSAFVDYEDRNTCVLFGDGAGAAVISDKGEGLLIVAHDLGCDGALADLINIPGGGSREPASEETLLGRKHYIKMIGREVFRNAVRRMCGSVNQCLKKVKLSHEEIAWLVPHQANLRIMDAVAEAAGVPMERVYKTVHKYGNTSASGIVIALKELVEEHPLKNKERVLLVAFGAGLTWGAMIVTKVDR